MTRTESTVLFLGAAALVTLVAMQWRRTMMPASGLGANGGPAASVGPIDVWTTPFYLRSNVPVASPGQYLTPSWPASAWSLSYPVQSSPSSAGHTQA